MDPGTAAMVIGSAVSAIGMLQAGINAQNAANFNARVNFNNAHATRLASLEDATRQRRLAAKRAGTNRAYDPDKLDLLEDTAIEEELAIQSILHAGEVQAVGFENNAQLEIAKGRSARASSRFGAFSTILIGGGTAFAGMTPGAGTGLGATGAGSTVPQFNPGNINRVPGSPLLLAT